jgi:hypothetical protein
VLQAIGPTKVNINNIETVADSGKGPEKDSLIIQRIH